MFQTLTFAAISLLAVTAVWFGKVPALRHARTASAGRPTMRWWFTLSAAVLAIAFIAHQLPTIT
jgi:hypothetical protein